MENAHFQPRMRPPVIAPLIALSRRLCDRSSDIEVAGPDSRGEEMPSSSLRLAYCGHGALWTSIGLTINSRMPVKVQAKR